MQATKNLIDALLEDEEYEIMTLIAGEDTDANEVEEIEEYVNSKYDVEIETHFGGQAVYSWIIGVEQANQKLLGFNQKVLGAILGDVKSADPKS